MHNTFFEYILKFVFIICCIECPAGYFGLKCMTGCIGHCKDNEPCNHLNGFCEEGCLLGWTGVNCDKRKFQNFQAEMQHRGCR